MNIQELTPEIQRRISRYWRGLPSDRFTRPERKFIGEMLQGLLKEPGIYLTEVARCLGEGLKLKKTWERLNRNLRREGLWERLIESHLAINSRRIRRMRYCVIDVSDIQKQEATKIEGLSWVRDGDKSSRGKPVIGRGFHWLNAVMVDKEAMLSVYSEAYSLELENSSENLKILGVVEKVGQIAPEAIFVLDRGGDRAKLLDELLSSQRRFIIRGAGQRSLKVRKGSSKSYRVGHLVGATKCSWQYQSLRGKTFYVGIRRVYYKGKALSLVVSRRANAAVSWYLTNVEGKPQQVMKQVMEGYTLRWRIEEYHRQIKQSYHLENIRLRKYVAIKNMVSFVMLAASFISRLPENLVIKLLCEAKRLFRNKLKDIPNYYYYMLTAAVSCCLAAAVKQRPVPLCLRKRDFWQHKLALILD